MKRRFKKALAIIIVFVMIFVSSQELWSFDVSAAEYSGVCGENLTWKLDTSTGALTISGTGAMTNWTSSLNVPWYSYRSSIKSVTTGNSVTSIGNYAFASCGSLTSVTIGNSVTSIGNYAFAYYNNLTSMTIPDSVTSIGSYAFVWCTGLTSVTIGNSVISIGSYAFDWCSSLTSVTIPDSVTSIGDRAFGDCDSLTSIEIPDSVTSIGEGAFCACDSLTSITVDENNAYYSSDEYGVLFNKDKTELIQYPIGNKRPSYTIPDSVTSIGNYAFASCGSLTSVTIPDSVKSIGNYAFASCGSLTSVTIGNAVKSIGDWGAFYDCKALTSITVDENNTYYSSDEYGVLFNKNKTELVQYPIGNERTSYTIPDSVTSIGNSAFRYCDSLTSVTIGNSVTSIGDGAFDNCDSLTSIEIPDSVTSIGNYAFASCGSLTSVTIGNGVMSIGGEAFSGCDSLTSITIGNGVTSIGDWAFSSCDSLTDIYYDGTKEQWNTVSIGTNNDSLFNATIHFLATGTFIINGGIAQPGETVEVTISAKDNPGIVSALLKISYDAEKLTLVSVENGEIFANGDFEKGNDLSAMPYTVLWLDATAKEDYTADGKLLTLTFKVADDAPEGDTEISITYDEKSTFNAELQPVSFTVENGTVTIKNRIPGDANGDDELNLKDVVAIRRYLAGGWGIEIDEGNADVDGSGDVNLVDVALITRFLADWDVTLV